MIKKNFLIILNVLLIIMVIVFLAFACKHLNKDYDKSKNNEYFYDLFNLSPNDFAVYLINLNNQKERLTRFTNDYSNLDIANVKDFERVPAVDGKLLNLQELVSNEGIKDIQNVEWYGYRTKHNQLTTGAVGCYLSHLNVYKRLLDSNLTYGIIFEDDVKFIHKDFYKQIRKHMQSIPPDWDILLLGCVCHVCKLFETHKDMKHFFLLHAYVIRRCGAEKIMGYLKDRPIRQQIDSELSTLAVAGKIKIVCVDKNIVIQNGSKTTIQTPLKVLPGLNPFDIPFE